MSRGNMELVFTVGIPGSGKSVWVSAQQGYFVVCPDRIRELIGNISDQSMNNTVWLIAKERILTALSLGHNVILDATNVNTAYRKSFLSQLFDVNNMPITCSLSLKAKLFDIDPETAISRIESDINKKVQRANVPREVVYRMYGEYLYTKKVIASEGFEFV